MDENIKTIIENYTLNAFQVALISAIVSFVTFLLTIIIKNYFENKLYKRKLETEHRFNQQKMIKEVFAKYKVHLLTSCEDYNYRMWNFYSNHSKKWINISDRGSNYNNPQHYYFHSFVYRFLSVLAWIKKIQKEIIFIDTTLASKNDLEFIKFMRVISRLFCDLTPEDKKGDKTYAIDHFYRDNLNLFPDSIITESGIKSYSEYMENLTNLQLPLLDLYKWFDGISPLEDRKRWDVLYFLHLTIVVFLNNYGYDFQKTNEIKLKKLKQVLDNSQKQVSMKSFFELLGHYKLNENKEVKILKNLWEKNGK